MSLKLLRVVEIYYHKVKILLKELLVLHYQFLAISHGDLSNRMGITLVVHLHVCFSDPRNRECTCSHRSPTPSSKTGMGVGAGSICVCGYDRLPRNKPLDFSAGAPKLFERQQLTHTHRPPLTILTHGKTFRPRHPAPILGG